MDAKIKVDIGADIKELDAKLDKAGRDISGFSKNADKSLKGINSSSGKASKGISSLGKSTANATPTLQEFSRVVQDAPFGIIGVGNNITQLVSNFGNLQKTTGSASGAFKALIGSLAGPGGVLLAISTVVTLLTVFSDKLFNSKTKAEELADATKKAAEELDKFVDSLDAVNRSQIQGAQSAQKEIVQLNQLRAVVDDTSRSTTDRQKAVQELQRLFPDYFGNLKDEQILNGNLQGVYEKLTQSILKRAKASAASEILIENARKEITLSEKLNSLKDEQIQKELELQKSTRETSTNVIAGGAGSFNNRLVERGIIQEEINDLTKEQLDIQKDLNNLAKENVKLSDFIDTSGGIDLSGVKIKEASVKKVGDQLKSDFGNIGELAALSLQEGADRASEKFNLDLLDQQFKNAGARLKNTVIGAKTDLEIALEQLNQSANNIITGSIANTFAGLGASIGNALAQGEDVLGAIGSSLLQGLGNFLSDMGKLLIEYGTLAVVKGNLDIAIASLPGVGTIAAGLAAIGVGIALSAAGAALSSAANGGTSSGSTGISSGGGSTSRNTTSGGGGFQGGEFVFRIAGYDLIAVLDKNRNRNLAIGGSIG